MAPPRNNDRPNSSGHTGTIPKSKVRNNCNVPQEAVTPTRRDLASNLVSTSLDWVPVSEYNTRTNQNHNQSRKPSNNTSDHDLNDLDNSLAFESGFGRFVPVRPQPRVLPLNVQNRENPDQHDDGHNSSMSAYSLHPYSHTLHNGLNTHSNHAAAAVMIVNPTTPNAVAGNFNPQGNSQVYNSSSNQNRNNLTRNLNTSRNNFEGNSSSNNNSSQASSSRSGNKAVNLINNMYEQQGSSSNLHENNPASQRESARVLGEALVAACPDASAVERRLGQIREYIRVTSSLVDTMRNSEDEDVVVRPLSVQSNGSAYSENELWQNEVKNKMEVSSQRLVALKQQQQRLLKYQAEAKMQLDEINRQQAQEIQPSTSNENFSDMQQQQVSHHRQLKRGPLNQVGVATTLAHSSEGHDAGTNPNLDHEGGDDRYNRPGNHVSSEEAGGRDSDEDEGMLSERGRQLQMKLRELQLKKQHMENLVSEFQKLQMDQQMESARNTYSSSGEESADDEPARKCNNSEGNMKNEDPFKLMEIKAIKAALQKTKDLMRSVENYESEQVAMQDEPYQGPSHSGHNLNDNKSSDGGSAGGWSNDGSVCRVRNSLPQRRKYTNEEHHHQGHDMNIASLQELAQQLRMETEKIMGERARLKDVVANKAMTKHKKVNEEMPRPSSGSIGPAERRQLELKALLAQKQKELEALINNEKTIVNTDSPKVRQTSNAGSLANQSYNSEPEESTSRQGHIMMNSQNNPRDTDSFRAGGDTGLVCRSLHNLSSQVGSVYCSDSDSASRTKTNQRNRLRRKQQAERQTDDNSQVGNSNQNLRHEPRVDSSNVNMTPPIQHTNNGDIPMNMQYPHMPPPPNWGNNKSNQDMRTNQFTQNSHSQTMDRLMGTPPLSFPPSIPPMMMPYGSMGGCGCGCGVWGVWCWQQLLLHQRDILQLRDQIAHLEERWRAETASNILNNQVPPGNRANNYWDNFRRY